MELLDIVLKEKERLINTIETYKEVIQNDIKDEKSDLVKSLVYQSEYKSQLRLIEKILKHHNESRAIANNEHQEEDCPVFESCYNFGKCDKCSKYVLIESNCWKGPAD